MTVVVTHSTPADGTFSATGATAWNADHTLSGVGTMAGQDANAVAITGGSISGVSGIVTSVTGTAPVVSSGGTTPAISMAAATALVNGYLTSTDWSTFNGKGSGSVTSVAGTGTVSGISLSGTVTSSGNLTLGGTLDLSSPPAIGSTAANTGAFTTLSASSTVSGAGFTTYLASPPAIGGTTAAAGTFTTLTGTTSTTTPIVQNSAAAAIAFKTNSATSAITQFNINHTASAVNYVQVTGAATGGNPAITAQGSDGAINLVLSAKSTSSIYFYTNNLSTNSRHLDIIHTGTVVNRFQITGSQTGNPVVLGVNGGDSDIDITLTPKGAGRVNITTSIKPKVNSATSVTSPLAWNSTSYDEYALTALANALTISADANTAPADGQRMMFRFKDNGTAQTLTWTTGSARAFRVVGVTLPTTTVASKLVYVGCIYNAADSRWDVVAVSQEA
jgi:hypothetical protein